jgi:hypothetical protein
MKHSYSCMTKVLLCDRIVLCSFDALAALHPPTHSLTHLIQLPLMTCLLAALKTRLPHPCLLRH